ncbi:hypothetical protein D0Z07_3692 [Hyphodiscus hymeniophilus]|uniref:Uncharacterized protein n=1 Tax=Hyphodiscus hymeniophilus TaxID=353542 RepID=A0A9P7AYE9_9HELO|nr:hypothetical protein D0Z07_3692 [Hyphodiscus hymeniophilus]
MASANKSTKTLQQNRPRPSVPRAIIPAIPLPYIQKRKQAQAAREKALEEAVQATQTPIGEAPPSPTPPPAEIATSAVEGLINSHDTEKITRGFEPAEVEAATAPVFELGEEAVEDSPNGERNVSIEGETTLAQDRQQTPMCAPSAPSEEPPSASRSDFHMPPAFVPHSQTYPTGADESVKDPRQHMVIGQQQMHHTHPSAGSVMFGAYEESNNSSPAPPPSAGKVPPYPSQQPAQAGLHGPHLSNGSHGQHMSNGFSPMGPPPGYYPRQDSFIPQHPGADNFARRQMVSFGPPDGYSPSATPSGFENQRLVAYDPTTPHSFHGSQSSAPNEQENGPAFYSQYPTAVISNGSNGHIDEVRLFQQPRPKPRSSSQVLTSINANANFPGHPMAPPMVDHLDGLVNYIQAQFAEPELADYTLELRYSDDRAEPVRIPGHGLIFGRSPTLKSLMKAQAQVNNGDGLTGKSLLIESEDRFLRSDGFWMALQRVYGGPLLDIGAAAMQHLPRTSHQPYPMPGTAADRCELGLGYAAAGHILQIPPVVTRGAEIASHFVNWDTIESALDFALDGGVDTEWTYGGQPEQVKSVSTYGPAVNIIIYGALNFIISTFPPNFELDTSVGEPITNRRLPPIPEDRPSNSRLSFIKFGDHPSEEIVKPEFGASITATLSKILLNLPFHLLQYVLESPRLGNVEGWASTSLRHKVMHNVIEERERRRTKVSSSAHVPQSKSKVDDNVRWQEAVVPHGGHDGSLILKRTFIE